MKYEGRSTKYEINLNFSGDVSAHTLQLSNVRAGLAVAEQGPYDTILPSQAMSPLHGVQQSGINAGLVVRKEAV